MIENQWPSNGQVMADAEEPEGVFVTLESQVPQGEHFDRWNGVLLLVRKDCANVKFTTCFDKTHPFTENTLSFPVQIENLTLAKSSCVRVKVLRSSDQFVLTQNECLFFTTYGLLTDDGGAELSG